MKLNAVNVIEYVDGCIQSILSFTDDEKGNEEAETLFEKIIQEHENNVVSVKDMGDYLDNGLFSNDDASYQVFLVHSML
jgi:hypothetical protein